MSDRLTAGQLRDLAEIMERAANVGVYVERGSLVRLARGLRKEADAREAETKPVCVGHTGFCPICHAKPAPDVERPTREDWDADARDNERRSGIADYKAQHDGKPCVWHPQWVAAFTRAEKAEARVKPLEEDMREARGLVRHYTDIAHNSRRAVDCPYYDNARSFLARTAKEGGGA